MEIVNEGKKPDGCDTVEKAAAIVGVADLVIGWIPIFGQVSAIVTSPVVVAGAMCTFSK